MQIKVCLMEPNSPPASELVGWIAEAGDLNCVGVCSTMEMVLVELPRLRPDVVLVDLRRTGRNGAELVRKLKAACPDVLCLVLTAFGECDFGLDALRAGASGCLSDPTQPSDLVEAIRQVYTGGSVIAPRVARRLLELFAYPCEVQPRDDHHISKLEERVLQFLAEGRPRKDIADALDTNTHKLDYIIRGIYRKLHVNCVAAAVSAAMKKGIAR